MINVKITTKNVTEDFIAVERETGAVALPSKHVFGVFVVGVISVLLALPFGSLVPEQDSPFMAFSNSQKIQVEAFEQAYLKNDEKQAEESVEIVTTAGSEENYDDEILPEALFAVDNKAQVPMAIPEQARQKFYSDVRLKEEIKKDEKYIANILSPEKITQEAKDGIVEEEKAPRKEFVYDGKWYEQTVRRGDSLFKIFNYLNLEQSDLKAITKVANKEELSLSVGQKIQFRVNQDNLLQEITLPLADNKQARFSRDLDNDSFAVTYEDRLAQFEAKDKKKKLAKATTMPGYIEAQKEREAKELALKQEREQKLKEQKEKEALLAKENAEKAKASDDTPAILPKSKVDPLTRPRLIIGSIGAKESFDKAAARLGLTRSEIVSIKNQYSGKINFRRLKAGDSFRVLFNGIGQGTAMTAISVTSSKYGQVNLYRHPQNHIFYEENGYTPSTGNFRRFPIMGQIKVNSPFNLNRYHPIKKRRRPHYGVDFKLNIGTPVYAPSDGVVTYASYMRGGGYTVILSHKNGYNTVYMHLSKFDVRKGQEVHIGQIIGKSGNTGYSTGPHLHYEVHVNGRAVDPLKVDLPSGSPATAARLRDSFKNTVYILKSELYKEALAQK